MNLEALQAIALAVAQERSEEGVLARIVEGLGRQPDVALARVWMLGPGDLCDSCAMSAECPDRRRCLHLAASAGTPHATPGEDWSRLDDDLRRVPLGVAEVGRIAATGSPLLLKDAAAEGWARPEWAQRESIRSFAGQPLVFRGETIGVVAVFRRAPIAEDEFRWLRTVAEHAAIAIVNARAFAEIDRLSRQLEDENAYLREEVDLALAYGSIVGQNPALRRVLQQVEMVAPTDSTVLVLGETGTGKELVARAIHERSHRARRPLIKVNCGAIPRDMFESEFFGHVRGAFTGALRDRPGRFQLADGGTVFLDEVGDLPVELQPKLLRVLQEGQYERVGDDVTRTVDVRVIAATNRDLKAEVRAGRFREDLYYRLGVFLIELPPLRERKGDIPLLASHFVSLAARKLGVPEPRISMEEWEQLKRYDWPGNVRELQNVIERTVILSRGGRPRIDAVVADHAAHEGATPSPPPRPPGPEEVIPEDEWRRRERANLVAALKRAGGHIYGPGGAAELLGVKPSTLQSRLRARGIHGRDLH
ncbi:MAG TPA: sigma 54-interacting transcriptional regulator [Candidatus Limnocylindria bacterium]|nr:sigma 54-interacting transcriptional regulator [Candidatus Limnocylindria bacterium]